MWPGPRGSCPDGDSRDAVTTGELSTGSARLWRNRTGLGSLGVSSITSEGSVMPLRRLLAVGTAGLLCVGLGACDPASDQAGKPSATATTTTSPAAAPPSATTTAPVPRTTATSPPASSTAPTSSAPASSSSAPAVAAPDPKKYPAMNQQTELGAQQAYEYFWQTYAYARISGDPRPFKERYSASCHCCAASTAEISSKKKLWREGKIAVTSSRVLKKENDRVDVYMEFATHANLREKSTPSDERFAAISILKLQGGRWRVTSVDIEEIHE